MIIKNGKLIFNFHFTFEGTNLSEFRYPQIGEGNYSLGLMER